MYLLIDDSPRLMAIISSLCDGSPIKHYSNAINEIIVEISNPKRLHNIFDIAISHQRLPGNVCVANHIEESGRVVRKNIFAISQIR